jgi:hypothetical protein
MSCFAGPEINESGLVLYLDAVNYKSFKGEATTNLSRNSRDFSGTAYASLDEWVSSEPTRLTKTYVSSIPTPIGNGATLIQESGTAGYHHLSRYGGTDESGAHSLSCYVFPLTSDITDFCIGMLADGNNNISFNLVTKAITYGPGISNRDAFITPVVGFDGWYRVGANIEGRTGGWVGCFGYSSYTSYTGTSGAKKCYITGIQYESKSSPTSFVEAQTTRGTTVSTGGGWADLTGRGNNGELVNGVRESSANGGSLSFDGTDDYVNAPLTKSATCTFSCWARTTTLAGSGPMLFNAGPDGIGPDLFFASGSIYWNVWDGGGNPFATTPASVTNGNYHYYVVVNDASSNTKLYYDGVLLGTAAYRSAAGTTNLTIGGNTNTYMWNGNISNFSIHNRALSAAEVSQNFNALRGRYGI